MRLSLSSWSTTAASASSASARRRSLAPFDRASSPLAFDPGASCSSSSVSSSFSPSSEPCRRVRRGRLVQVGLRARDATLRRLRGYPVVVQRLENFIRQRKRHLALIPLGRGPARPAGRTALALYRVSASSIFGVVRFRRAAAESSDAIASGDSSAAAKDGSSSFFESPLSPAALFSLSRRLRRGPRERRGLRGLRRLARGALQQIRVPGVRHRAGSLRQVVGSPR